MQIPTYGGNSDSLMANSALRLESEPLAYDFADLSFDVTENGSVRNIRMLSEETAVNSNLLARLRRNVRLTFFRPLIIDGEPERSDDNQFRYRYWY